MTSAIELKKNNLSLIAQLKAEGESIHPILVSKQSIAESLWGKLWCKNLERYEVFSYNLNKGRSLLRNSAVIDLQVFPQKIIAKVNDSDLFEVHVKVSSIDEESWLEFCEDLDLKLDSVVDLMKGILPDAVISKIYDPELGIYPEPKDVKFTCTCPDESMMCAHAAAALYAFGFYIDNKPEDFFKLRNVDFNTLIQNHIQNSNETVETINNQELEDLFGIDLA